MQVIGEQILRDRTDPERLSNLYDVRMSINDREFRHLMGEDHCPICVRSCRIRRYIVESICCNNRVCNSCHIEHLSGTTRPYCMYCKSVWTHYNITNWFTPKDAKCILNNRVYHYSKMSSVYNNIKYRVAEIIKEQIAPLFPIIRAVSPVLTTDMLDFNSFIIMLKGYADTGVILSKRRKYLDVSLESIPHITDDDVEQLVDSYRPVSEGKGKKKMTRELEKVSKTIMSSVHDLQQLLCDNSMTNCPKCSAMILDFDTERLHSIDCPYCGAVMDTTDFKLISTSFNAPICKITGRHLAQDTINMFKKISTQYSIAKFLNSWKNDI